MLSSKKMRSVTNLRATYDINVFELQMADALDNADLIVVMFRIEERCLASAVQGGFRVRLSDFELFGGLHCERDDDKIRDRVRLEIRRLGYSLWIDDTTEGFYWVISWNGENEAECQGNKE
jgi:hypothetical protein